MKKLFSVILCLAILFNLSACADERAVPISSSEAQIPVYEKEFILPAGDQVLDLACVETTILLLAQSGEERYIAIAQHDGASVSEAVPLAISDGVDYIDIAAGVDDCFYVLSALLEPGGTYQVQRISSKGELLDIYEPELDDFPHAVCVLPNGELLLFGVETVTGCTPEGEVLYSAMLPGTFISAELCDGSAVIFAGCSEAEGLLPCFEFDPVSQTFSALAAEEHVDVISTGQGISGEYIFSDGRYLLAYSDGSAEELCLWNPSRYAQDSLLATLRLGENEFLCAVDGENYLLHISLQDFFGKEREIVSVAVLLPAGGDKLGRQLCEDIIFRENLNGEYEYVPAFYAAEQVDGLLSELTTGKAPDLLIFFDGINTATGAFEDLYPYLDADSELSRDSFLPNLTEALATEDKLYQLWDQVCVKTISAPASLVGNMTELSCADYDRILLENPEYDSIFPPFFNREGLLEWLAGLGVSAFMDKRNGSCDFTNSDFASLLSWCAAMPEEYSEEIDTCYILEPRIISSPWSEYAGYENGELKYEPNCFVGFPNGREGYSFYSNALGRGLTMAIPVSSTCIPGAWEFIHRRLIFEEQADLGAGACLPVNREALEYICSSSMSPQSAELLKGLLERTKSAENFSDEALKSIIRTAAKAYFCGDKTLEDTLQLIQSRASIYISEQYG